MTSRSSGPWTAEARRKRAPSAALHLSSTNCSGCSTVTGSSGCGTVPIARYCYDLDGALPEDVDPDIAWRILTAIRHQTASVLPFETYQDIGYSTEAWYTVTRSMSAGLKEVERHCSQGSSLDKALPVLQTTYPFMRLLEEELAHALLVDDTPMPVERIHGIFMGGETGLKGLDLIVKNFHDLLFDLGRFAHREVSPSLIDELYWRLVAGEEDLELPRTTKRAYRPIVGSRYHDPDECKRAICGFATLDDGSLFHPVIRLACAFWLMSDFRAVPHLNSVVEILLRHLLTQRWECPVLGWVPFNRNDEAVGWDVYGDARVDCGYGLDCTYLFQRITDYLLTGIGTIERISDEYAGLADRIEKHLSQRINPRQRAILLNALSMPDAALRIEPHRLRFGITYPTARSDYLQLAKLGYLEQTVEGRAFVFHASDALKAASEHWD